MAQLDDLQAYINSELPRRSATLTTAITGYDGDPNDGGAPDILKNAPIGTWYVADTGPTQWRKLVAGATGWSELGIGTPGSSTDHALVRWDGTGGDTIQNSGVTLSDSDAMVFPTGGSISKPDGGPNSEAYGAGASTQIDNCLAVGNNATIGNASNSVAVGRLAEVRGGASWSTVVGYGSRAGSNCSNSAIVGDEVVVPGGKSLVSVLGSRAVVSHNYNVAVGAFTKIHPVSSGDSIGAIAIGGNATVGNVTPGAGCDAAIAIGENATINPGSGDGISIGAASSSSGFRALSVGHAATCVGDSSVSVGRGAACADSASVAFGFQANCPGTIAVAVGADSAAEDGCVAVGYLARARVANVISIGRESEVHEVSSGDSTGSIAIGYNAEIGNATPGAGCDAAIAIGENAVVEVGCQNSIAMGSGASIDSTAIAATAIGLSSSAQDNQQVVIGPSASGGSAANSSVAIGLQAFVTAGLAVALGPNAGVSAGSGVAIGSSARSLASGAVAVGDNAIIPSAGTNAISVGIQSNARDQNTIAIGNTASVRPPTSGDSIGGIAIGRRAYVGSTTTTGAGCGKSIALGYFAQVDVGAVDAIALGPDSVIYETSSGSSSGSIAVGSGAAIGDATPGGGCDASIAIGQSARVSVVNKNAVVIGPNAIVHPVSTGNSSGVIVIGNSASIGSVSAFVGCRSAIAIGKSAAIDSGSEDSIALGPSATIGTALRSIALGPQAVVGDNNSSVAIGYQASANDGATGTSMVAIGFFARAGSAYSMAMGVGAAVHTPATGVSDGSIAIGREAEIGDTSGVACVGGIALGYLSKIYDVSSGDSNGSIAIGEGAVIGDSTPGAGCDASVVIGKSALIEPGSTNSVCIGYNSQVRVGCPDSVVIGRSSYVADGAVSCVVIGNQVSAFDAAADNAVVIGTGNGTNGRYTVSIGWQANTRNNNSIAIGGSTLADGTSSVALGYDSDAGGSSAVALGHLSVSDQSGAVAVGGSSKVYAVSSGDSAGAIAVGNNARVGNLTPGAGCNAAIAIGEGAVVSPGGTDAVVVGPAASATKVNTVACGKDALTATTGGVAIGYAAAVDGTFQIAAIALGYQAKVYTVSSGDSAGSIAIGRDAQVGDATPGAGCDAAICIGENSKVNPDANNALVIGSNASVGSSGQNVVVLGLSAGAASTNAAHGSVVVGASALSNEQNAVCLGVSAKVHEPSAGDSIGAIAIGSSAVVGNSTPGAGCNASIAIGEGAQVQTGSLDAIAIGVAAVIAADAPAAIAIGQNATCSTASSDRSIAIGYNANAASGQSVVIGDSASETGGSAVAIGRSSSVAAGGCVAVGSQASAGFLNCTVVGNNTSSEASGCVVIGSNADALGASTFNATVVGTAAEANATEAVSVGYATDVLADSGIAIGAFAVVRAPSSGDNNGAICIGKSATVGSGTPGAANEAAIAMGEASVVQPGADNAIAIGPAAVGNHSDGIALGRSATTTAANRCTIGTISGAADKELQFGLGLGVWGVAPPGSQPAKISDPTDLPSAITAITAIIDVLEGAGLSSAT